MDQDIPTSAEKLPDTSQPSVSVSDDKLPTQKSNTLIKSLLILLVCMLGILGYFGFRFYTLNQNAIGDIQPVSKPTPRPTPIPTPIFSLSVNPTTGQNLYTNTTYGFSFEYPEYFVVLNQNPPDIGVMWKDDVIGGHTMNITPNYLKNLGSYTDLRNRAENLLKLKIGESYRYESAANYFETATRTQDQKIGGKTSYIFDIPNVWNLGAGREIYIPQNNDYLRIFYRNFSNKNDPVDYLKGFTQILSTFKFINPKSAIYPNYNHYENNEVKFSFDYPNYLTREEIDHPYGSTDKPEKLILFCENQFETNHEQGSPHCINGGGIRIWYNLDAGWISPCPDNKGSVTFLGTKYTTCSYPVGLSLYVGASNNSPNTFSINITYSDKLTSEETQKVLSTFKFTQ